MIRSYLLVPAILAGLLMASSDTPQDKTGKRLSRIQQYLKEAGDLYKEQEYEASAKKIAEAQTLLARAAREGSEEYREKLEKEHRRIAKAHELLTPHGIELTALEALPEVLGEEAESDEELMDDESAEDAAETVSFKDDVSPLLVRHCGNCHIRQSRGEFSLASFEKLMQGGPSGDAIVAGEPDDSVLYQMVESGDMPPRNPLPEKDVLLIKTWIEQGGEFDGEDKTATLQGRDTRRPGRPGRGG